MARYICIHGHFYQPPRENPWLEAIEVEDSAAPYHDWNERIAAECYRPMGQARILDGDGYLRAVVNNYASISFNFGATLLTWMEHKAPEAYQAILDADRASRERFSGHGSAMAQAYNHVIMPLANERDRRTQVIWGIRDFEHRFGRRPEGMWLPETAVDVASLEALAEQGILFTILAPHQAKRVRDFDGEWQEMDEERLETSRPYVVKLPSGREMATFFYDGALSRAVAFERLVANGEVFAQRLVESVPDDGQVRLAHIATDGETYGHHHRFAEMGLAFAIEAIESREMAHVTNYGAFLEEHPPTMEAEIAEDTSWSCAHGIERWRSDCGCNSGGHPGWNQTWRTPLRDALDRLRERLTAIYEREGGRLLRNAWVARDSYIDLLLDRSRDQVAVFIAKHAAFDLSEAEKTTALRLLEMQRQAMLMYSSCAWFFDDVSGIETQQGLRHAARAIQLSQEISADQSDIETGFLERLEPARSNMPEQGSGADVYRRYVVTTKVDLRRLAAHYAVNSLFHPYDDEATVGSYVVRREASETHVSGHSALALGKGVAISTISGDSLPFYFGVLHFGDQNITGGLNAADDDETFQRLAQEAAALFSHGDFAAAGRFLDEHFTEVPLSLRSVFRDEQRRILSTILDPVLAEAEGSYRHLYEEHISLIRFLTAMEFPSPQRLSMAAQVALDLELGRALQYETFDEARARMLLDEAKLAGVSFETERLALITRQTMERLAREFEDSPADEGALERLQQVTLLLRVLPFVVDIGLVQGIVFRAAQRIAVDERSRARLSRLGEALKIHV